eukprot:m.29509 g.29509  ORF g.29509 m.29509 type:complete len:137 (-) comp12117_c0_seq3:107-517(-)
MPSPELRVHDWQSVRLSQAAQQSAGEVELNELRTPGVYKQTLWSNGWQVLPWVATAADRLLSSTLFAGRLVLVTPACPTTVRHESVKTTTPLQLKEGGLPPSPPSPSLPSGQLLPRAIDMVCSLCRLHVEGMASAG